MVTNPGINMRYFWIICLIIAFLDPASCIFTKYGADSLPGFSE